MGLIIVKQPTATVEMEVEVPGVGTLEYHATWALLGVDEFEKLNESQRDITDVVAENFKGLAGPNNMDDVKGQEITDCDEDALREILDIPYYRKALVMSFIATQQGRAVYAAKN